MKMTEIFKLKHTLFGVLAATVFLQSIPAVAEDCPEKWPVTVQLLDDEAYGNPLLKVLSSHISGDTAVGDRYFTFDRNLLRTTDTKLIGTFTDGKSKKSADFEVGEIIEILELQGQTCLNISPHSSIECLRADKKKSKTDCGFLPDWMCRRSKNAHLRLSVDASRKQFVLDSSSSFSRDLVC